VVYIFCSIQQDAAKNAVVSLAQYVNIWHNRLQNGAR
jgi:hypothetical protein